MSQPRQKLICFRGWGGGGKAIWLWLNEILIYKLNISLYWLLLFRALWWMDSVYTQICYLGFHIYTVHLGTIKVLFINWGTIEIVLKPIFKQLQLVSV